MTEAQSPELSEAEKDRLRDAAGRSEVDFDRPLFASDSTTWRVQREAALLLAGGRALLLQVAHPLVAQGVAEHSDFEARPLDRLRRTLDLTLEVVFAPARDALRAVQAIESVHARVRGRLPDALGPYPAATPYDANDPGLGWWVYATLLESSVVGTRRFVRSLGDDECHALYRESAIAARLFGIPDHARPPDWHSFRDWFNQQVQGDTLTVGEGAKAIANAVLQPRLPFGLSATTGLLRFVSHGLLPEPLRSRFGVQWSVAKERRLCAFAKTVRGGRRGLPAAWRCFPRARRALREAGRETGADQASGAEPPTR